MSADILREAARQIRAHNPPCCGMGDVCCQSVVFMHAVADWLAACALVRDVKADSAQYLALTVARAYLGEST